MKVLHASSSTLTNTLTYFSLFQGSAGDATEANKQHTVREAGTLSDLSANIVFNTFGSNSTLVSRVNGSNGNQSVSVTASSTGYFTDSSNTDSISAADEIAAQFTSGTTCFGHIVVTYDATASKASLLTGNSVEYNISEASVTRYLPFGGQSESTITNETEAEFQYNASATLRNMYAYVSANARTTTTTVRTRVNSANGNISVSITSTATGVFEDTTNTDSISTNDTVNFSYTTGAGTEALTLEMVVVQSDNSDGEYHLMSGDRNADIIQAGETRYFMVGGELSRYANEGFGKAVATEAGTASNLFGYVDTNNTTASSTITFYKNSATTSLTASVAGGATGTFEDASNTASVADTDDISIQITAGTGGTLGLMTLGALFAIDNNTEEVNTNDALTVSEDTTLELSAPTRFVIISTPDTREGVVVYD